MRRFPHPGSDTNWLRPEPSQLDCCPWRNELYKSWKRMEFQCCSLLSSCFTLYNISRQLLESVLFLCVWIQRKTRKCCLSILIKTPVPVLSHVHVPCLSVEHNNLNNNYLKWSPLLTYWMSKQKYYLRFLTIEYYPNKSVCKLCEKSKLF